MADARLEGTEIADSVIDVIGDTPLVRLRRVSEIEALPCVLAMKMETSNPGGSSKDRPALEMMRPPTMTRPSGRRDSPSAP